LTRHGNSYALVIDKPIMELLDITASTPIEIATDGKTLVLSPVRDVKRKARFAKALKDANRKFGRALKNLAR
jgi:antitoxin MazE